jgi:deazaflavin-dependent oxidoreductase (nitroreductase family)
MSTTERYLRPGWFTKHVANRLARRLARMGVAPKGLRQLAVRGRTSGEWRTTPVNLLELDGRRYLVAPRGHTEWVRNIRVAGGGELRLGRKVEPIQVRELADEDKPAILRAYLVAWKAEVKAFFSGIDEHSTDEQLLEVAPGFPAFEVLAA